MEELLKYIGFLLYGVLGLVALWGAFCVVMVWRRVSQTRFRSESDQDEFLDELDRSIEDGNVDAAIELCDGDGRAVAQLSLLALSNRKLPLDKLQHLLADRFQRDVMADLEHRLSWVNTVIKSAPMVGLLGTVVGMMGAFAQLSSGGTVDQGKMAENIAVALITTACGLSIAIPLVFCTASINARIRRMEDLAGAGLTRLLETCRSAFRKS